MREDSEGSAGDAEGVDCWNRVGIRGDRSCPQLAIHTHCRNCPTYSASARRLQDRDLPARYVQEWTEYFARPKVVAEQGEQFALIFRIGGTWLALGPDILEEVAELRAIRPVPHRRNGSVLGLCNVRGEIVLCVSLGKLLGLADEGVNSGEKTGRLIVVDHGGRRLAFPVDEVSHTMRYRAEDLGKLPDAVAHSTLNHAVGILSWQDRLVAFIDTEMLGRSLDRSVA